MDRAVALHCWYEVMSWNRMLVLVVRTKWCTIASNRACHY